MATNSDKQLQNVSFSLVVLLLCRRAGGGVALYISVPMAPLSHNPSMLGEVVSCFPCELSGTLDNNN